MQLNTTHAFRKLLLRYSLLFGQLQSLLPLHDRVTIRAHFLSLRSVWEKYWKSMKKCWSVHRLKGILPSTWNERKGLQGLKKTECIHTHSWCRWKCNSSRPICWMIWAVLCQFGKVLPQSDLSCKDMTHSKKNTLNSKSLVVQFYFLIYERWSRHTTSYNFVSGSRAFGNCELGLWLKLRGLKQKDIQRLYNLHLVIS